MRAWLAACLVLFATAALVLWRAMAASAPVAPPAKPAEPVAHVEREPVAAEDPLDEPDARADVPRAAVRVEGPTAASQRAADRPSVATRLSLLVLEVDGRPWTHGRVLLERRIDASLAALGANSRTEVELQERTLQGTRAREFGVNMGRVQVLTSWLEWTTDAEGRADLPSIPPGVEFEVRALDALGAVGGRYAGPPFVAGEVREATLRLERRAWPVEGRCIDPLGAPLRARVTIRGVDSGLELECDEEGRFASPPLFTELVTLHARKSGLVRQVHELALPCGLLELAFERARVLTVTLADPDGAPFTVHELRAYGPPGDQRIDTFPEVRDGAHEFDSMPWVPLTLAIEGCGGRPTFAVDAHSESVTWTLPRPGTLRFEWAPGTATRGRSLRFELARLEGAGSEPVATRTIPRGHPIPEWKLFAGRYRLEIRADAVADADGEPSELPAVTAVHQLEVRAGGTAHVTVGD